MTLILQVARGRDNRSGIRKAAKIIRNGGIVVFPTETVYGIGANALDANASRKIYKIKGRKQDNPLIVHVSDMRMAQRVAIIPDKYIGILGRIWPAPLTIIVKARSIVPKVVTAGLSTVAIRVPDNAIALSLIRQSALPIAAPSANMSKKPSSTDASHVKKYFDGKVDAIIDGGRSRLGIESTVIDLDKFMLLRPGSYPVEEIEKAFNRKIKVTRSARGLSKQEARPLSPGMKYRHYSPDTPIFLFTGKMGSLPSITKGTGAFAFIGSAEACKLMKGHAHAMMNLGSRSKPGKIASNLFGSLIALDSKKADFAIIEGFKEEGIGLAVMNRIRKACANKYFSDKRGLERILRVQRLGN